MTHKALRVAALDTLAKELAADQVNMDRVNAAVMALNLPADPDEEREAHRAHVEAINAVAERQAQAIPGTLMPPMGQNMAGPAKGLWGR